MGQGMDISLVFFFFSLLKWQTPLCHGQYEYSYRELGPNMNIHITWLTYVRTGPKKKNRRPEPPRAYFFFWTHFRLSRWMATHLRMRSATPSVYFDLEKGVLTMIEQNDCQVVKATPQVISNKKELQPITTMCLQWTVNKTGKYLATVQFLLSPLKIIF